MPITTEATSGAVRDRWVVRPARRLGPFGRLAALVVVALAATTALVVTGGPASGHSDTGTMGLEVAPGTAPLTAHVRVLLEFADDRHRAPGATVVASATGPAGATVTDTPLTDRGDGTYDGTLTMPSPGDWTVTVTATSPDATATANVTVSAAPATSAPTTPPTTGDVQTSSDQARRRGGSSDDGGGGPSAALLVGIAVVVVAAAGVGVVLLRRR